MRDAWIKRLWHTVADWVLFELGTLEIWLFPQPETPEDRAIREQGERLRKAFPAIDFDHPGARIIPRVEEQNSKPR